MPDRRTHYFQAVATVQGELTLDGPDSSLAVADSSFPVVVTRKARKRHKPWLIQRFFVYPTIKKGKPALRVNNIVDRPIHPMILKGCWEIRKDKPCMVVYRNELLHENDRHFETVVPVVWENAPPADGQFYELEAEVSDGGFFVVHAEGPFEPPPKATEFIQPPTPAKSEPTAAQSVTPVLPLTVEEIRAMATPAKIQVTCKLNEVPKHRELADKRIEFFLQDGESDRIFTVRMKPKIFKKLTEHGFTEWVAAITGEIGPATETGFELVNAAVQVFEKKAREADAGAKEKAGDGQKGTEANDNAEAPKKDGVAKRKGLLDGVRLK
jgi:hypothetical protein